MASGICKGLLTAALVVLTACSRQPEDPGAAVARAIQVLRDGRSAEAGALARAGAERWNASRDAAWYWRFRHIEAESHLYAQRPKDAAAVLQEPFPTTSEFDTLRVERDYLQAYARIRANKAAEDLSELPSIAARAESLGRLDVALDVVALHAQSLLIQGQFPIGDQLLFDGLAQSTDAVAHQRAKILGNLGMSRLVRNRFDEALTYFERVLADRSIESSYIYRAALSNAGICYARLGDIDKAVELQRRAVEGHERAGLDQYLQQSLGELGTTFMLGGRTSEGIAPLRRALDIALAKQHLGDGVEWANNLATAYGDLGDWDHAEQANNVALQHMSDARASSLTYYMSNRARIAAGRGQTEAAIAGFEEALNNAKNDPFAAWKAHAGLAHVYRSTNRTRDATRHFEEALGLIERTRVDLLKREHRLTFLSQLIRFHQDYIDALVTDGNVEHALEVAESSRARVLAERQRVARGARVPAAAFVRMAARTQSVLLSYWLAPARSYVWIITDKGIRCVTLPGSQEIAPLVRGYRDLVTVSLADPLAVSSSPGTRLTETILQPVLDAIPSGANVVIVPDGALHDLNFDMLPVSAPMPHYWIEDVTVTLAPSLALAVAAAESHTRTRDLTALSSGAQDSEAQDSGLRTQDLSERPRANRSLLLVGDPVHTDDSLPPLAFAGAELTGIERVLGTSAHVLRGANATPRAVTESQPARFDLIHFAAHATANAESPLDSAILLSPDSSNAQTDSGTPEGVPSTRARTDTRRMNGAPAAAPSTRAGTATLAAIVPSEAAPAMRAGADSQTKDGVSRGASSAGATQTAPASYKLYARDVAALPLTADVVTLSACRSAGGRAYGGEGLVGFAWAFLRAGARQVVAGLWDVDDQATALLMERYYQRLAAGATAAAALRDAKLSLLESKGNFRKPYYWAAFAVFATDIR